MRTTLITAAVSLSLLLTSKPLLAQKASSVPAIELKTKFSGIEFKHDKDGEIIGVDLSKCGENWTDTLPALGD
ncbi:MAG: hypothetical protein ABL921_22450 [Pirellula sp.]